MSSPIPQAPYPPSNSFHLPSKGRAFSFNSSRRPQHPPFRPSSALDLPSPPSLELRRPSAPESFPAMKLSTLAFSLASDEKRTPVPDSYAAGISGFRNRVDSMRRVCLSFSPCTSFYGVADGVFAQMSRSGSPAFSEASSFDSGEPAWWVDDESLYDVYVSILLFSASLSNHC